MEYVTRKLRKLSAINKHVKPEKLSPPALLQRSDPLQKIDSSSTGLGQCSRKKIELVTANERIMACFHEHHQTCHKGYYGRYRCRFCRKSGICYGTKCVILRLLEELEQEIIDEDDITETMLEDPEYETNTKSEESNNQISKYSYTINQIVHKEHVTYHLRDPLFEKVREDIIVWELDRPTPDFKHVSGLENQSSQDKLIE